MAASATEMSCTAVTITNGMSGYFSFVRSNSPMPSRFAIIRSESINSNSSPELRTASASMPEPACLQAYPAVPSIDATISRIGSSSSTTRMRSGMGVHERLSAIVPFRRDSESNHRGSETPYRFRRCVIFRDEDSVRPQYDERFPVIDVELAGKAGTGPAVGNRMDAAHPAGSARGGATRHSRQLLQSLGSRLGGIGRVEVL